MLEGLAAVALIGVMVLWAFYGFRYSARPAGVVLSPPLADYVAPLRARVAKGILLLAKTRILPESYLYGLSDVRAMATACRVILWARFTCTACGFTFLRFWRSSRRSGFLDWCWLLGRDALRER
jgi:hypothetical protein